jgi:flagellin-like protein
MRRPFDGDASEAGSADRGDDRAVSPVIGVILMVAITVILAAVIGVYVLSLGSEFQQASPTASFTFDFAENAEFDVTATHNGGATFTETNTGELRVVSSGDSTAFTLPASAGDAATVTGVGFEEDVRVIWESPDGSTTTILGSTTTPPA